MSNPNYQETNLVEGSWAASAGQAEEANNPFHIVTPKDIEGLNASINDLKTRVDKLGDALSGIETILKLLTRQQVSGYLPQSEQAATAPTTDATLPATATPPPRSRLRSQTQRPRLLQPTPTTSPLLSRIPKASSELS